MISFLNKITFYAERYDGILCTKANPSKGCRDGSEKRVAVLSAARGRTEEGRGGVGEGWKMEKRVE